MLNAAIEWVEQDCLWAAGFDAYERGKSFPKVAAPDFICGWRDAWEAHGGGRVSEDAA